MKCNCEPKTPYKTKELKLPLADTFGPFHDETVLSGIDKVLYFLGIHKLTSLSSLVMPNIDDILKNLSQLSGSSRNEEYKTCGSKISTSGSSSKLQSVRFLENIKNNILCPKCGGRTPSKGDSIVASFLKNLDSSSASLNRKPEQCSMGRSLSLCSLACRKVKDKLSPRKFQWCWTRKHDRDCHQVYEIFQNLNCRPPPNLCKTPKMILIVNPRGVVFPFETVLSR